MSHYSRYLIAAAALAAFALTSCKPPEGMPEAPQLEAPSFDTPNGPAVPVELDGGELPEPAPGEVVTDCEGGVKPNTPDAITEADDICAGALDAEDMQSDMQSWLDQQ